jgi:hypothetical protein
MYTTKVDASDFLNGKTRFYADFAKEIFVRCAGIDLTGMVGEHFGFNGFLDEDLSRQIQIALEILEIAYLANAASTLVTSHAMMGTGGAAAITHGLYTLGGSMLGGIM